KRPAGGRSGACRCYVDRLHGRSMDVRMVVLWSIGCLSLSVKRGTWELRQAGKCCRLKIARHLTYRVAHVGHLQGVSYVLEYVWLRRIHLDDAEENVGGRVSVGK